jgi:NTE family protein
MKKADKEKAIIKFLKSVELFQGLSLPGLKSILKHIEERTVRNHEFLFYKDEVSEHIFIIRYGEFIIESFSGQGNIYAGPGDVISENSLLLGTPHSASSYAMIDSLVYAIDGKAFMQIALKERRLSQNIMKLLSERMRENLDGFASSKKQIARRLFCHIPLDSIEDYKNKLESILEEASEIQTAPSILINISQFKGLSHEKFAETLSEIRKKTPLVHLFFESPELAMDLPSIVLQSDWIIFWEKEVNKNILAKEHILNFWQKRIRNFNGRTVLFQSDPSIFQASNQSSTISGEIFYKKFVFSDALARFLVSKTRGIALGGGGARALSHIGLLKVLQKEGLRFDYISGASFGAVIAALYARGDSIEKMESLIRKFFGGIESTFDPTIPFVSFFKGKKMRKMLKDAFGDLRIEELSIPFVTSAVDLQSGKEYIFDRGPISEALTATMSLPGAFPPYFLGEKVLVDGGMVNNVPEDLIRAKGADVVIGVNVSPLQETVSLKLFENRKASGTSIFPLSFG